MQGVEGLILRGGRDLFLCREPGDEGWQRKSFPGWCGHGSSPDRIAASSDRPVRGLWDMLLGQEARAGEFDFIRQGLHGIDILYVINISIVYSKATKFLRCVHFLSILQKRSEAV